MRYFATTHHRALRPGSSRHYSKLPFPAPLVQNRQGATDTHNCALLALWRWPISTNQSQARLYARN